MVKKINKNSTWPFYPLWMVCLQQMWHNTESVNIITTHINISGPNSRLPCLFGRYSSYRGPTLHCTGFTKYSLHRRLWEWGGRGQELLQFLLLCGEQWWAHSRPLSLLPWRQRSEWTHRTEQEVPPSLALHQLSKRTRTLEWAAIWNLRSKSTEKYTNNSIFPFLWPTQSLLWRCYADLQEQVHLWTI